MATKRAIVIQSEGRLDVAAITLMGLSTKRDDKTKIGMFGTGLKYSIAKLLRDAIPFRIWDGAAHVDITTRKGSFRDHAYEQVVVNGETTSITTDMGPQWEPWWIVRELLSNARDESMHEFYVKPWDEVEFTPGWTAFVLDYDTFEQVWLNREKYFLLDRLPKWEGGGLAILPRLGEGTRVYKRGVLIHESKSEDAFDYDLANIELNEMRELRYDWQVVNDINRILITTLDDAGLITEYMNRQSAHLRYGKKPYTGDVETYNRGMVMSNAWKHVVAEHTDPIHGYEGLGADLPSDGVVLPQGLAAMIQTHLTKDRVLEFSDPNTLQRTMLDTALQAMYAKGFAVTSPIKVADLGPQTVAQVVAGNIVLHHDLAFKTGHQLVCALLEEQLHITTGLRDMTRAFQTSIFQFWAVSILDEPAPVKPSAPPTDDFDL